MPAFKCEVCMAPSIASHGGYCLCGTHALEAAKRTPKGAAFTAAVEGMKLAYVS